MLVFSLVSLLFTYAILRLQQMLPLNPQGLGPVSPDLAFNTAASFTSNTNWQNYGGESTMSYLSQMVGLTIHNFGSAAVGIAAVLVAAWLGITNVEWAVLLLTIAFVLGLEWINTSLELAVSLASPERHAKILVEPWRS